MIIRNYELIISNYFVDSLRKVEFRSNLIYTKPTVRIVNILGKKSCFRKINFQRKITLL